jgi:hypothetical protein
MTTTLEHVDIEVKDGSQAKVVMDFVFDKHDGLMIREIYNGHEHVLGRFGLIFTPNEQRKAFRSFKRCVAYRRKKYGE